jgi:hypothetical protein
MKTAAIPAVRRPWHPHRGQAPHRSSGGPLAASGVLVRGRRANNGTGTPPFYSMAPRHRTIRKEV